MNIINIPSPNFVKGRKGYHPEAVVIHIMEGTLVGTDSWFKNPQSSVSAHYGIGLNGAVHQYVQEADTAWQAGRVNAPCWSGIKPANNGGYVNPNYYTIGIEHEGSAYSDWTDEMYGSSCEIIAGICERWKIPIDRLHIIGHREIYSLKSCPGYKVDLDRLVKESMEKGGYVPVPDIVNVSGTVKTTCNLNLRKNSPSVKSPVARTVSYGTILSYIGYTEKGDNVQNSTRWYQTNNGLWFWGGKVEKV